MNIIGYGILTWDAYERRSNRYGSINLVSTDFCEKVIRKPIINYDYIESLVGKRVKLTAVIKENRESGHCGDMFLNITPSMSNIADNILIGIGILFTEKNVCGLAFGLKPSDNRDDLWLDPRSLYKLHDQTVEIFAELSNEPDHIVEPFNESNYNEGDVKVIENNILQFKNKKKNVVLKEACVIEYVQSDMFQIKKSIIVE